MTPLRSAAGSTGCWCACRAATTTASSWPTDISFVRSRTPTRGGPPFAPRHRRTASRCGPVLTGVLCTRWSVGDDDTGDGEYLAALK